MKLGTRIIFGGVLREIDSVRLDSKIKLVVGKRWLDQSEITVAQDQSGKLEKEAFKQWRLQRTANHAI